MDIERINYLEECKQEDNDNFKASVRKMLLRHLNVVKQEVKDNGGRIPQHRIDEEKRLGLI